MSSTKFFFYILYKDDWLFVTLQNESNQLSCGPIPIAYSKVFQMPLTA